MSLLTRIAVDNFRSLFKFDTVLNPLTVIVGRNDAGKSNLLKTIRLLLDEAATAEVDKYDYSRSAVQSRFPRHVHITGTITTHSSQTYIKRHILLQKESGSGSTLEIQEGQQWRKPSEDELRLLPAIYYLRPRTGALQEAFSPKKENNIYTLIKDWMPKDIARQGDLDKLMRGYAPSKTNLSAYVNFIENEVLGPLTIAFPPDILPHRTLNADFRTVDDRGRLFVRELIHSKAPTALVRLPLDHHGSGLISVVAIVLTVAVLEEYHRQYLPGKPLLIALEEPEVHLHANAQYSLLNYVRWLSGRHQVLMSTHSPLLMDRARPENVLLLRRATLKDEKGAKGDGIQLPAGTTIAHLRDFQDNWKEIRNQLGIRLSDALMAGEFSLLVEGVTEALVLPALARVWNRAQKRNFDFDRVFIVIGEGGNLPHLARILQGMGNATGVLLDGDAEGKRMLKEIVAADMRLAFVKIIESGPLPTPRNKLVECEFEDILDPKLLLRAFNQAYSDRFDFLPFDYTSFEKEQLRLLGLTQQFGWVATIESLVMKYLGQATSRNKQNKFSLNKRLVAQNAAALIESEEVAVPSLCSELFGLIEQRLEL